LLQKYNRNILQKGVFWAKWLYNQYMFNSKQESKMSNAFVNKLLERKGQIATFTTARPLKVRKNETAITKTSTFQARVGVDYDNIKAVQEKRASGELPAENAGLPWGTWNVFPYVIEHKGEFYFRCTRIRNNFIPKTTYTRDGVEITKEEAERAALASEFKADDGNEVFNIKVSSILNVA
jgi:hypothetical protein